MTWVDEHEETEVQDSEQLHDETAVVVWVCWVELHDETDVVVRVCWVDDVEEQLQEQLSVVVV